MFEQLEDETSVVFVLEGIEDSDAIEVVDVFVIFIQTSQDVDLVEGQTRVRRFVGQDLDGHDLVGGLPAALEDLAERAAAEEIQNLILKSETAKNALKSTNYLLYKIMLSFQKEMSNLTELMHEEE